MYDKKSMDKIAMLLVDEAVRDYIKNKKMTFLCLILGDGQFKLEAYPGAGHNYYVVLEAIYEYYKKHPFKQVDKMLFDTLIKSISISKTPQAVAKNCDYIAAQIENEKKGISPFKLDNIELLKQMKARILNNIELSNNELAHTLLNDTAKFYEETTGEKIL